MGDFTLKNQWIKTCTGIELHVLPDSTFSCRYCSVSVKGQVLTIDSKGEESGSLEAIAKKIPADRPLSLIITGKDVLIKKISTAAIQNTSSIFPNFKAEDFYEQRFTSADSSYFTIIRKETADKILGVFDAAELQVLCVSLGPFAASHILPQLNFYDEEMRFDGHIITVHDSAWINYQYQAGLQAEFPVKIETEVILERLILAYAAAFQLCLSHLIQPVNASVNQTSIANEDFIEKKKFRHRSVILSGSLFILLFFNFLIFNYLNTNNQELQSQLNASSSSMRNSESIIQDLKANERQVRELGWHKGIRISYILDQIGQTVPGEIKLSFMKIGSNNDATARIIHLRGAAKELESVNDWMYRLQEMDWIKKVTLDHYRPAESNPEQIFNLTLKY